MIAEVKVYQTVSFWNNWKPENINIFIPPPSPTKKKDQWSKDPVLTREMLVEYFVW